MYNQWLPEIAAALAYQAGGLAAVAWLAHATRLLIFLTIFVCCRITANPLPALIAATLGMMGTVGALGPRPQLIGLLLFVVTYAAWLRTIRDGKVRWWLVPITWLWACCHGTWATGLALGFVVCCGLILDRKVTRQTAVRLLAVPALGALSAAFTPTGLDLFRSIKALGAISPFIEEWQAPTIRIGSVAVSLGLGLAVLVFRTRSPRRTTWTCLGLIAMGMFLTLTYQRTVALGAILFAPLLAAELHTLMKTKRLPISRSERLVAVCGAAASLAMAALILPATSTAPAGVPTSLDPTLRALSSGTVVYNTDGLGGWLMWAHPNVRGTSDTRAEVFGPKTLRRYQRTMAALPGWESDFARYGARYALIRRDSALSGALRQQLGWHMAGSDAGYVLLVAPEQRGNG